MFVPGDLVFFAERRDGREVHNGGIVVKCEDGVLMLALLDGTVSVDMRASGFVRAWLVEHAPAPMGADEALAFSERRLAELVTRPLVVVHPDDEPRHQHAHAAEGSTAR